MEELLSLQQHCQQMITESEQDSKDADRFLHSLIFKGKQAAYEEMLSEINQRITKLK